MPRAPLWKWAVVIVPGATILALGYIYDGWAVIDLLQWSAIWALGYGVGDLHWRIDRLRGKGGP